MTSVAESFVIMPLRGMSSSASKFFSLFEKGTNTFGRNKHATRILFTRAKTNRMQTSPPRDVEALAKLQARIKYNPSEVAKSECVCVCVFVFVFVYLLHTVRSDQL